MMNQNAIIGSEVERLFKNSIDRHPDVIDTLREHFGIGGNFARAFSTGPDGGKSDVIIAFTDRRALNANIKAYNTGFNQATRLSIAAFCGEFGLEELCPLFEAGAVRKAAKAGPFIAEADSERVIAAITPLAREIVHFSLSRLENPELLVLYNRRTNEMQIYDMQHLLDNLDYEVSTSPRGVIRIGRFLTIQRKGGNGVKFAHIAKTDLKHPGNGIQVKMKVGAFALETAPIVTYQP